LFNGGARLARAWSSRVAHDQGKTETALDRFGGSGQPPAPITRKLLGRSFR
jgi:hypothetical protein